MKSDDNIQIAIPLEHAPRLTRSLEWHEYQPRRRWTMGDAVLFLALVWVLGWPAVKAVLYFGSWLVGVVE